MAATQGACTEVRHRYGERAISLLVPVFARDSPQRRKNAEGAQSCGEISAQPLRSLRLCGESLLQKGKGWRSPSIPSPLKQHHCQRPYFISTFLIELIRMDFLPSFSVTSPLASTIAATNSISFSFLFAE